MHAQWIGDAVVAVYGIAAWQGLDNLLVVGDGDGPSALQGAIHVLLRNAAVGASHSRDASAVQRCEVRAPDADVGGVHGDAGDSHGLLHRCGDGLGGLANVHDDALAHSAGRLLAHADNAKRGTIAQSLGDERADLCRSDVYCCHELVHLAPPVPRCGGRYGVRRGFRRSRASKCRLLRARLLNSLTPKAKMAA